MPQVMGPSTGSSPARPGTDHLRHRRGWPGLQHVRPRGDAPGLRARRPDADGRGRVKQNGDFTNYWLTGSPERPGRPDLDRRPAGRSRVPAMTGPSGEAKATRRPGSPKLPRAVPPSPLIAALYEEGAGPNHSLLRRRAHEALARAAMSSGTPPAPFRPRPRRLQRAWAGAGLRPRSGLGAARPSWASWHATGIPLSSRGARRSSTGSGHRRAAHHLRRRAWSAPRVPATRPGARCPR